MGYEYNQEVAELQEAVDISLAIRNAHGVIVSDGNGNIYSVSSIGLLPKGTCDFDDLPSPSESTFGYLYQINDDFTTTSDFIEGAGVSESAGSFVAIINDGTILSPDYKYCVYVFGTSVVDTVYGTSSSMSVQPSTWQDTMPTVPSGDYLWTRIAWESGAYTYLAVRQGIDGDMSSNDYDPDDEVFDAGGIPAYVQAQISSISAASWNGETFVVSSGGSWDDETLVIS